MVQRCFQIILHSLELQRLDLHGAAGVVGGAHSSMTGATAATMTTMAVPSTTRLTCVVVVIGRAMARAAVGIVHVLKTCVGPL